MNSESYLETGTGCLFIYTPLHIETITYENNRRYTRQLYAGTNRAICSEAESNREVNLSHRPVSLHRPHVTKKGFTHVIGLALALGLVICRSAECAVGAAASRSTVIANPVASVVVSKSSRDRELVRGDERDVRARPTSGASRVDERGFEERTVFAVESTCTSLEVSNCGGERPVACVCTTRR
jgi:hypothetical protein